MAPSSSTPVLPGSARWPGAPTAWPAAPGGDAAAGGIEAVPSFARQLADVGAQPGLADDRPGFGAPTSARIDAGTGAGTVNDGPGGTDRSATPGAPGALDGAPTDAGTPSAVDSGGSGAADAQAMADWIASLLPSTSAVPSSGVPAATETGAGESGADRRPGPAIATNRAAAEPSDDPAAQRSVATGRDARPEPTAAASRSDLARNLGWRPGVRPGMTPDRGSADPRALAASATASERSATAGWARSSASARAAAAGSASATAGATDPRVDDTLGQDATLPLPPTGSTTSLLPDGLDASSAAAAAASAAVPADPVPPVPANAPDAPAVAAGTGTPAAASGPAPSRPSPLPTGSTVGGSAEPAAPPAEAAAPPSPRTALAAADARDGSALRSERGAVRDAGPASRGVATDAPRETASALRAVAEDEGDLGAEAGPAHGPEPSGRHPAAVAPSSDTVPTSAAALAAPTARSEPTPPAAAGPAIDRPIGERAPARTGRAEEAARPGRPTEGAMPLRALRESEPGNVRGEREPASPSTTATTPVTDAAPAATSETVHAAPPGTAAEPTVLAAAPLAAAAPGPAPAAAPVDVPLPTPVTAPEFREALGVQVSVLARDGVQQAELHLNPADMGPIAVRIVLDGTQAQVDFGVDSAQTRALVESGLPELASALREAGLTLTGGGVSQHPGDRSGGREPSADAGSRHRGEPARDASTDRAPAPPRPRTVRVGHGLDLYA